MSSNQSRLKPERLWPRPDQTDRQKFGSWPTSRIFIMLATFSWKSSPFDFNMGVQFFNMTFSQLTLYTTDVMRPQWFLKALHSCLDPAVGIHPSRLGNSLLHIPQREYHQHMTRAPLTLGHLACCLPLQPLHTENACVYVHVSWTATFNTLCYPQTERNHREKREWEKWDFEKRGRQKEWWGTRNMLVSSGYATYVVKWLMGNFFVLNFITPFLPSFLCQFLHHPSAQSSSHFQERTLSLTQLSAQHRSRQRSTS